MFLFHLRMDDSSLVGWFPGNFGGGAPANIGVHIFIGITPTWDLYKGWFFPGEMLVLVYDHNLSKIYLSILLFPDVGLFLEVWRFTQIPTENNEQMPDHNYDMIQLELRILPCHLLFCKNLRLHKPHCDHLLSRLILWLHQDRIVHIHGSHPSNVSSLHIHHGTSFNQTLSMSSPKKHLHVEICNGTVLSWRLNCYPKERMPSAA